MIKPEQKICQNCHGEFQIEPEDFVFYDKIKVPAPTWCSDCRLVRRLVQYNKRTLYKISCGLCGKTTFSMYSKSCPMLVYCNACWWSDKWEGLSYAKEYDFSVPFFLN